MRQVKPLSLLYQKTASLYLVATIFFYGFYPLILGKAGWHKLLFLEVLIGAGLLGYVFLESGQTRYIRDLFFTLDNPVTNKAKKLKPSTRCRQNTTRHSMPCFTKAEASSLLFEAKKPSLMVFSNLCFLYTQSP